MRRCKDELIKYASDSLMIIDERHKLLNETKRTSVGLELSSLCQQFIILTGTPVIDDKIYKLIYWLKQIVQFQVNLKNFFVSVNSIVARKVSTGIKVDEQEIIADFTDQELIQHRGYIPLKMGGENTYPRIDDFNKDSELCYRVSDRKMIEETLSYIYQDRGVFLVSRNIRHQEELKKSLMANNIKQSDIFVLNRNDSIYLTDEMVDS